MLATGSSGIGFPCSKTKGSPKEIHFATIIASQNAIDYLEKNFANEANITLWVAAIDPELNEHSYIVPGLGDAGDLAYGQKYRVFRRVI